MSDRPLPFYAVSAGWQVAFWVSYVAWIGMETWVLRRDRRRAVTAGRGADRGSRWLIVTVIFVCLGSAFSLGYATHGPRLSAPELMRTAGMTALWAGMALRLWAIGTLGIYFRGTVVLQEAHQLIQSGPYALLRNPSYAGSLLTLLGIGLMIGHLLGLLTLVLGPLLAYLWRIHVEESALAHHFGASYVSYRARSWALIPGLW